MHQKFDVLLQTMLVDVSMFFDFDFDFMYEFTSKSLVIVENDQLIAFSSRFSFFCIVLSIFFQAKFLTYFMMILLRKSFDISIKIGL